MTNIFTLRCRNFLLIVALFFSFSFCSIISYSQNPGEWMWIRGDSVPNLTGNYGSLGIPAPTNDPPSLYETCEWTDLSGNFWLFGGQSASGGYMADLWMYNPATNEWTWVKGPHTSNYAGVLGTKGTPAAGNNPPYTLYGAASWVDLQGDLWMFGGYAQYSDLWRYHIATNEWTWINGPGLPGQAGVYGTQGMPGVLNHPPYRWESAANWTDNNGDLWLFGGYAGANYNDLWRYNIASNEWTWMKGAQVVSQQGFYGTKGVEAAPNTPGCRLVYCNWKDNSGNLWVFGGNDLNGSGVHNDLWRYNIATNNWAWMSGDSVGGATAVHGTKCTPSASNVPACHWENRAQWTDQNGNFWMLGGPSDFFITYENDLWMYSPSTNQWMWASGDSVSNLGGSWGVKGVSAPSNKPSGRGGNIGWYDGNCHLYMFGGGAGNSLTVLYNDLWVYKIDPACGGSCATGLPTANFTASDTISCSESGFCVNFSDQSAGNPTSWHWLFPGATPDSSLLQNPDSICYYNVGTYPVTLIVTNSGGTDTVTVSPKITLASPPAPPTITVLGGDTLVSSQSSFYQWYLNGVPIAGATDSFYVAHQGGTYSVRTTNDLGCGSISGGVLITTISETSSAEKFEIYPNPSRDWFEVRGLRFEDNAIEVFNVLGEKIYSNRAVHKNEIINCKSFASGVYFVRLTDEKGSFASKFVKE